MQNLLKKKSIIKNILRNLKDNDNIIKLKN